MPPHLRIITLYIRKIIKSNIYNCLVNDKSSILIENFFFDQHNNNIGNDRDIFVVASVQRLHKESLGKDREPSIV